MHSTFPPDKCQFLQREIYCYSVGSAPTKWRHNHVNTYCNVEYSLLETCSKTGTYLPGLAQRSLLYVGQMCNSGCSVTFTALNVTVTNGKSTILTGLRDKESSLLRAPLESSLPLNVRQEHSAHNIYEQNSIQETITYLHVCCFSPLPDTWIKSIQNGHFATWPSVTVDNVRKYIFKSDATANGHMNQIRQNEILETNQIYSDLTGRFPTTSLSGNKDIVILFYYDSNIVLLSPMRNRGDKEMERVFDLLIQSLIILCLKPHMQLLDNEASLALRNYLTQQGINYKLAPPHIHRRNNAERAIHVK
jgi:hypothetical protein